MKSKHSAIRLLFCFLLAAVLLPVSIPGAASADNAPAGYPAVRPDIDFGGMDVYFYDWYSADYWDSTPATDEQAAQRTYRLWLQDTYHVQVHTAARSDWNSIADDMIAFAANGGESDKLAIFTQRGDEVLRIISAGAAAPITYDLSQGKWSRANSAAATVKGKTYAAYKGASEPRQCLFFNKRVLEDAGISWSTLYDAQDNGTWTWDMFTGILSRIQQSGAAAPLTGNRDDFLKIAVYTGGGAFIGMNADGNVYSAVGSDETKAALSWALGTWQNYSLPQPENSSWDWYQQAWANGEAAFFIGQSYEGFNNGFSGFGDEWGCLVFPKKEAEGKYINLASNNVIMIPSCYDSATVDKLMFLYDMWTLDTPGYPEEDVPDRIRDLTDERAVETYRFLRDPDNQVVCILLESESISLGPDFLWLINIDNFDEVITKCAKKWDKRCREYNSDFIGGFIDVFPNKSFKVGAKINYSISGYDTEADQYVHLLREDGQDLIPAALIKAWDSSLQAETKSIPAAATADLVPGHYYLTLGPDMEYGGISPRCVASTDFMILSDGLATPEFREVTTGGMPGTDISGTVIMPEGAVYGYIDMLNPDGVSYYWDEFSITGSNEASFSIPGLYTSEAGEYQIRATALTHYFNEDPDPAMADSETAVYSLVLEGDSVPACPAIVIDPAQADYPDKTMNYTIAGAEEVAYTYTGYNLVTGEDEVGTNPSSPVPGESGTITFYGPGRYEVSFWAKVNGVWSEESEPVEFILNPLGYLDIPEVSLGGSPVGDGVTVYRTDDLTFTVSCENADSFSCDIWEQRTSGEFAWYSNADVEEQNGSYTFTLQEGNLPDALYLLKVYPYGDGYSSCGAKEFLLAFADDGVDTLSWSLENGILTISGNGYMADYDWGEAPWYSNCGSIREIRIESGVTGIGNYAFVDFGILESVSIPDTVARIGNQAFSCSGLKSITIPAGVNSIGYMVFSDCNSFTSILVDSGNANYSSAGGVLFNKDQTELLMYPPKKAGAYTIPGTVTRIADQAFGWCSGLTGVTIPESVAYIGNSAFQGTGLTEVTIPAGVSGMGYDVFADCPGLLRIDVSSENPKFASVDGVLFNKAMTILDTYPCGKTGSYTIPDGVTHISDYAFAGCEGLTAVTVPESVTTVDYCAFAGCDSLADVWYYGDMSQWASIDFVEGNSCLTNASIHYTLHGECGENLTWVLGLDGTLAISGSGPMTDYPRGVSSPWRWNSMDITKVVIGDGVTHIGTRAFWFASNITELNIPAAVESIGSEAFGGCASLGQFTVDSGNTHFSALDGVLFSSDPSVLVAYPEGKADTYTIPAGVTAIGPGAFSSNIHMKEATIPAGVTEIGEYAFAACTNLQGIVIPESVTTVRDDAFSDCTRLSEVCYAGDKDQWAGISIGERNECLTDADILFNTDTLTGDITWKLNSKGTILTISGTGRMQNYEYEEPAPWYAKRASVTTVVIEDGVTGIGNYAFRGFNKLATVRMADSVTGIGNCAFRECKALKTVQLSGGLTGIGSWAFEKCSALKSITLPAGLKTIGHAAFAHCSLSTISVSGGETGIWDFFYAMEDAGGSHDYLYHITLPASVETVDYGAFSYNPLPHDNPDFILPADLKAIESDAFSGISARFVWIPDGVESIGDNAFAECPNLEYVYLPYSCKTFGDNIFPAGIKVLVLEESPDPLSAETYARNHGYQVILYEDPEGGNG